MRDDDKTDLPSWLGLRSLPDFTKARWLGPALSVVVIALFGMAILVVFAVLGHALFDFGMDDVPRIGFGTGAVAVALIGAPFVIWRAVVAQKTVNVTEQGHITDRINTAVQGLGAEKTVKRQRKRQTGKLAYATGEDDTPDYSQPIMEEVTQPTLEVRIGAIYALERIAQDSDRDHVQIMEILCAYIRQNAPAPETDDWPELKMKEGEDEGPLEADWEERLKEFRKQQEAAKAALKKPREDIQVALTVIGRRSARQRRLEAGRGKEADFPFDRPCPVYVGPDEGHDPDALYAYRAKLEAWKKELDAYQGYRLDLREADLRGADLAHRDLKGAMLTGAYLQGARLLQASFQGAILRDARLQVAFLGSARLQGADLGVALLQGASFSNARLQGANLGSALLQGANFWAARLQGAILGEAWLQGAMLGEAWLQGANLVNARLQGAHLMGARLQGVELGLGRLQGAVLLKARLEGASLLKTGFDTGTDLRGATLRRAAVKFLDFTDLPELVEHLPDMFGDASVILPEGCDRPDHWPKVKMDLREFLVKWHAWQRNPECYRPPDPRKPNETM